MEKGRSLALIPLVALCISFVYYLASPAGMQQSTLGYILSGLISTTVIWSGCVAIVTLLWKKFPWERHPVKHLLYEILFIVLYLSIFFLGALILTERFDTKSWFIVLSDKVMDMFTTTLITFLITAIHEAYYFYKQWQENFSKSVQLEKENIQAQYNTLKAQINPHFLFNSLNSLVSLVEENPKAERFVLDLSDFLRFVLVSSDKETVPLREELMHLDQYVRLMSIRFGSSLTLLQNIETEALDYSLPPLVLQGLVENCIKHNAVTQAKPLHITVETANHRLTLSNNLQPITESESTGQGLNNIRGRYKHFTAEEVKVIRTNTQFSVSIPLLTD